MEVPIHQVLWLIDYFLNLTNTAQNDNLYCASESRVKFTSETLCILNLMKILAAI